MLHLPIKVFAITAGLFLAAGADGSMAMSLQNTKPLPTVLLSCKSVVSFANSKRAALCNALQVALQSAFLDHKFQMVVDPPATGGDVFWIRFEITRADNTTLEGHLKWATPGSASETGPTIALSVVDSLLTRAMYPALAKSLVKASPLPL